MIELHDLHKGYGAGERRVEAVRGVDLTIAEGETVALLGPNGAGKSTTIDLLLGLQTPDRGEVRLFGDAPDRAIAAGEIGAMLQTGALIQDLTVAELVAMMASLYPDPMPVEKALALAGADRFAQRRTQKLSGGETQRARAAVALVANPRLLVLDEPTAALDVQGRHDFWAAMRSFAARGRTILFATHYLEEADSFADRIVLMAEGRIVADGPSGEIKGRVGTRTIRATLPGVDPEELEELPGVASAERRGATIELSCTDSDAALRALLDAYLEARDVEVAGAGLEQAFLTLTAAGAA